MDSSLLIGFAIALGLLYWWSRDAVRDHNARVKARQDACPHEPEWQSTIRVNSILTMNPGMVNRLIPGARWLVKHCRGCGRQIMMYRPTLQPWEEFKHEYNQETIDRKAQYAARHRYHQAKLAEADRAKAKARGGGLSSGASVPQLHEGGEGSAGRDDQDAGEQH